MERRGLCSVDPRHAVERSLQAVKRADAEKDEKGADLPGMEASTAVGAIWVWYACRQSAGAVKSYPAGLWMCCDKIQVRGRFGRIVDKLQEEVLRKK
jgi:hypothetical protein